VISSRMLRLNFMEKVRSTSCAPMRADGRVANQPIHERGEPRRSFEASPVPHYRSLGDNETDKIRHPSYEPARKMPSPIRTKA